jgi:hypothetical protein
MNDLRSADRSCAGSFYKSIYKVWLAAGAFRAIPCSEFGRSLELRVRQTHLLSAAGAAPDRPASYGGVHNRSVSIESRQSDACGSPPRRAYRPYRRRGRVAEGGGLLNRYRVVKPYRGFESLRLRHPPSLALRRGKPR